MEKYNNFKDFYPFYLSEHKEKKTKLYHFIGTTFSLSFLVLFFITLNYFFLLVALFSGYGFAWISHFFIEKNKPATFKYPLYSLIADHVMYLEIIRGKHKIF